jgi:hypothetical protein
MPTLQSTIHIPKDVLFREIAGEAVILNVATGIYYGLNDVGTRMWQLLAEHGCLDPAYQTLLSEYDVPSDQLQADLFKLVDDLSAKGLLQLDVA